MNFSDLKLSKQTLSVLSLLGFSEPTEVQRKSIPLIINGDNLVIRSQTGSGKTAAFGIGLIERISNNISKRALVLTPTRELAVQVSHEVTHFALAHKINCTVVYGGADIEQQIKKLTSGYQIVVATPGRLLDLYRRNVIDLSLFDVFVLDEADQMLDLGFKDEVIEILSKLPKNPLGILVSATLNENLWEMANKYAPNAKTIEIGHHGVASTITEEYIETTEREKFSHLIKVLQLHKGIKTLIFRQTKKGTVYIEDRLKERGFKVGALQGDMSQSRRNFVLSSFKDGVIDILVATNVAARGLHIDDLGLIINYDKAQSEDIHLHRVGRTGRMGMEGKAISFVIKHESRSERMSEDHPDFAWMKNGYTPTRQTDSRNRFSQQSNDNRRKSKRI